ncbi:MAG TPA: heavy-metal-associated domain-containing protein [Nitriliruptorales bacterium]|nr:heavy-metal-associated domain-containing protein [Nitriliruptorales bacterium]
MATQTTLQVAWMDCEHCAERLGVSLERLEGVIEAQVDHAGSASIRFDESRVEETELAERVRVAGFDVV